MAPDVKTINIGREDTAYLPKEDEDNYSIHVKLAEAEVIRVDTTSFILKYEGLRFKFTEALSISLLF
jgi:hypothetical protein